MKPIPIIPENSPFTREQRQWLNGYLAGIFSYTAKEAGASSTTSPRKALLVLYGSQTGTAEGLARKLHQEAQNQGLSSKLRELDAIELAELANAENVAVVTSTYGDGEPPDNARTFWERMCCDEATSLKNLRYAVFALGDANYPAFCEFGKQCDARLKQLGALALHPRIDCDVDYDESAKSWREAILNLLAAGEPHHSPITPEDTFAQPLYDRKTPFSARLLSNRLLNAPSSAKEVRHFEISLEGSGLSYEVGDALGISPSNCPDLVGELLAALGCDGEEAVPSPEGGETSLRHALTHHYEITRPPRDFIAAAAECPGGKPLQRLLGSGKTTDFDAWLADREIIDLLLELGLRVPPAAFVSLLRKLQPRLYSISSSPAAHPGEVHATVGIVRYITNGRNRKGVCSTFLADRCADKTLLPLFIQEAHGFRLPADATRPIIMVGPGTGIAPFRAFLEERQATGATGRNWLFFGDQCAATDYLYRDELDEMREDGHLTRLDLAFSRDQADKIYAQHRMLEAAGELWRWLEEGAHFYVCGEARRMARDVDAALHQAIQQGGGLTTEEAAEYVGNLKAEKRYQKDVY